MWYVYQIVNTAGNYRYLRITQNPDERIKKHNNGSTKSTKAYRPFNKIRIIKIAKTRIEARKLEIYYKSGVGREVLKNIGD